MKKSNLVLYKNQPALITDIQGDKFEITLESGTKKVRDKDIILLHQGECRSLKAVLEAEVPPANLNEAVDFFEGETWQENYLNHIQRFAPHFCAHAC